MSASSAAHLLPGEDAPLPKRRGGPPVTPDQALGTGRRMERQYAERHHKPVSLPEELPYAEQSGTTPLLSVRVSKRAQWFAYARADMEGRDLSAAIREFIDMYGQNPPGSALTFVPPPAPRSKS